MFKKDSGATAKQLQSVIGSLSRNKAILLAADREVFVRNKLYAERHLEPLHIRTSETILLFMKQRKQQRLLADEFFGLLINLVAKLRM
jgi:hypothetical protein